MMASKGQLKRDLENNKDGDDSTLLSPAKKQQLYEDEEEDSKPRSRPSSNLVSAALRVAIDNRFLGASSLSAMAHTSRSFRQVVEAMAPDFIREACSGGKLVVSARPYGDLFDKKYGNKYGIFVYEKTGPIHMETSDGMNFTPVVKAKNPVRFGRFDTWLAEKPCHEKISADSSGRLLGQDLYFRFEMKHRGGDPNTNKRDVSKYRSPLYCKVVTDCVTLPYEEDIRGLRQGTSPYTGIVCDMKFPVYRGKSVIHLTRVKVPSMLTLHMLGLLEKEAKKQRQG